MSYQALYRKYRPGTFADVKGQEAIVTTLKNQLMSGRVGHAYLFCGTRGTGKTTVAKILAKALNCENLTDDGPCCECDRCRSIEDGSSMNVVEIDGASNNGVADVRQIVEEVSYAPIDGGKKVYIIDEVHMLTDSAFNALLKTLEEPPEYMTFILATTDPQKVLPTIQSRCQRYDFKRISVDTIVERLRDLLEREGVSAEDRALNYIARVADGSLRDALSLLEECISYYFKQELTFEKVLDVVGSVDQGIYHSLTIAVVEGRVDDVIGFVEELVSKGRDLTQFAREYVWYLRNLMIVKSAEDASRLVDMSDENLKTLNDIASGLEYDQIVRYIHVVSRLISDMRHSANKRVEFEIALIRLCRPQMENDFESLIDRMKVMERDLERLSDKLEAGVYTTVVREEKGSAGASTPADNTPKQTEVRPEAVPEDIREIISRWTHIEQAVRARKDLQMLSSNLVNISLSVDEQGRLEVGAKEKISFGVLNDKAQLEALTEIIGETTGKHVNIVVKDLTDARDRVGTVDLRELIPGVPIIEED